MYTFPNKLKNLAIVLMLVGFIGLVLGFLSSTKYYVAEAKAMSADRASWEATVTAGHPMKPRC